MQNTIENIIRLSPLGSPSASAVLKQYPVDFRVKELSKHEPLGDGEHLWLWIKKENANTDWVAGELAKQSGIARRNVSYAGRKDRFAVTEQWFSIYDPKKLSDHINYSIEGVEVQTKKRHQQKLRTGQLRGNYFDITLRDVQGTRDDIENNLRKIKEEGFPNYFGEQRFGHSDSNLKAALEWCASSGKRINRNKQSIYYSTLRSFLFNTVLAERVKSQTWNRLLKGELAQLSGSHSIFLVEHLDKEQIRCSDFDIHPTGPLPGKVKSSPKYMAKVLENECLAKYNKLIEFLSRSMSASRRSLRVVPKELQWHWDDTILSLQFFLPAGSYATVLLEQVFKLIK